MMVRWGIIAFISVITIYALSSGCLGTGEITLIPRIEVMDQQATDEVIIPLAVIDRPGWIVLHAPREEDPNAPDPGTNLGTQHLPAPGRFVNVRVPLNQPVDQTQTIFAMLHYDDPRDKQFTFMPGQPDDPPVRVNDQIVVKSFTVTPSE